MIMLVFSPAFSYMLKSCIIVNASKLRFEHRPLGRSISEVRRNVPRVCFLFILH